MKITIRHEPASSANAPNETCVWIVGDDGETTQTEYLKEGEQTEIELTPTLTVAATPPLPIAA